MTRVYFKCHAVYGKKQLKTRMPLAVRLAGEVKWV